MSATTVSDGVTTVTLGEDDLQWPDEHSWVPVRQQVEPSVTGAVIVQAGAWQSGRSITLAPDADNVGWITRAALDALYAWASIPGKVMTLTYRGVQRTVIWRHQDGAIEASPVLPYADPQPGDYYRVTLRFMQVSTV